MRPSQNLPLPPRIFPPFQQIFMCDRHRIYPSLPEYTPPPLLLFKNYMRPSQDLPFPPKIFFLFWERVVDSLSHIHVVLENGAYSVTEGRFFEYRI